MAGIVPLVPASLSVIEGGISTQCSVALTHVQRVLSAVVPGLGLISCPIMVCFVTKQEHVAEAEASWEKFHDLEV